MTEIKFTLSCPVCGGSKFTAGSPNPAPDATLTCVACGKKLNLADEQRRIEAETRRAVEERMRRGF
jgi:cytochrome c-type biogenesis protein CcmH/NrfF